MVGRTADGEEGLAVCRTSQPDAVVTAWEMPNLDGLELARRLRAEQPDLVIVLCSSRRPDDVPPEIADLGVAYLDKISSWQLPHLLVKLLSREQP